MGLVIDTSAIVALVAITAISGETTFLYYQF